MDADGGAICYPVPLPGGGAPTARYPSPNHSHTDLRRFSSLLSIPSFLHHIVVGDQLTPSLWQRVKEIFAVLPPWPPMAKVVAAAAAAAYDGHGPSRLDDGSQ